MHNYFMETERLGFSNWRSDDHKLAIALWGDSLVTKYISGTGVFTKQQIAERLYSEIEQQEKHGIQYWPVFDKLLDAFIGCCGLRPYDTNKAIYELGFHLKSDYWGKGYGIEAASAAINYAYTALKANGLFAGHNPQNEASAKMLEKLGFAYSHDEFYSPTGLNHPSYFHRPGEKFNPL